jgi:peroxiredoxin
MSDRATISAFVKAPEIDVLDIFDQKLTLESYKGKKVFLGFYRHAGCPFCNLRIHGLLKSQEEYKSKGLEMVFFFESSKETLLKSQYQEKKLDISIVSDPDKIVYAAYGIEQSSLKSGLSHATSFFQTIIKAKLNKLPVHWMKDGESINTIPAEFLIDENGVVKIIHYSKSLTDQMPQEVIEGFLK